MRIGHPFLALMMLSLLTAAAPAPETIWRQTATLPAPEAHQAACADETFVYAIASASIAKYDRKTGAKIAASTGDAHHLNSGFLRDGKIYCAHSNYPKKPESSQIMLLDPESMRLTLFKDFGNFGGSLTWCIWHEGHWWCNFAKYDKENAGTFLVKFDADWKEIERYTYPAKLFAELGKMSLSGGIWREGFLVVTGHDAPIVYRLRFPHEGKELEWVDQQKVPFTGQGFAADPVTKGLVGIQRAKKLVVFAEAR